MTKEGPQAQAQEDKLPELEFKEILKSKEKLANNRESITGIIPWKDYTLVDSGEKEILIFNDKLDLYPVRIPRNDNSTLKNILSDFKNIGSWLELESFFRDNKGTDLAKLILNKKEVKLNHHNTSTEYVSTDSGLNNPVSLKNNKFLEFKNGKYIAFMDPVGFFIAFQVVSEQGVRLPPNQWIKFGPASDLPKDAHDFLENQIKLAGSEIKEVNEKHSLLINDLGFNILLADNPQGQVLFSEELPSIDSNVSIDPTNKDNIFFCQEKGPNKIGRLDISGNPSDWKVQYAMLPNQYDEIKNLQLDPTGTFFLFYSKDDLVLITKDTLEEVKREKGLSCVNFDSLGRIRALNKEGYLVIYDLNYESIKNALVKRKAQALAKGIDVKSIFNQKAKKEEKTYDEATIESLQPIKDLWEQDVLSRVDSVSDMEDILSLRTNLDQLKQMLKSQNLGYDQIQFITEGIEKAIIGKEKEYAGKEALIYLSDIESKLAGPISINTINELRESLEKIRPMEGALDLPTREKARKLNEEVNKRAVELFGKEGSKVVEELENLMEGTKQQLEKLENKNEFDDWMEFRFPQFKSRLGTLLHDCPVEAFQAAQAITKARNNLVSLADTYGKKFELEYAKVRERATERTDSVVQTLSGDITGLSDRLKSKQFKTREEAERYLNTSEAKRVLEEEIAELGKNNPDAAKELERNLKVSIANTLGYVERSGTGIVSETGQQMVMFGDVTFPKFEGKVKEKQKTKVDVTFVVDDRSKGPGVSPQNFYGDVELIITDTKGKKRTVRLYEELENEDEWRLGILSYKGDAIPKSYITVEEFKKVKKNLTDWENGKLKNKDEEYRKEMAELFSKREKAKSGKRDKNKDEEWQKLYKAKFEEYSKFNADNHIPLFKRIDSVKNLNGFDENGKGYVPKWQSHWVVDPTTEKHLEEMAEKFKMQGDLQEGVLNLYGHAGTGKDVLVKMFASKEKANRPYFAVDCTKWTTEYELAEDVMLEAKDGATQTVRVPSSVLTGIQTPGALVYFNELNAMPEQAQIFLHALFDEKRAMTLKTSSGKVVQALPNVLFASSMNPNYPGTFEPQFATKSRMVAMEVDYPALRREVKEGEATGKEQPYNSSEALRVARGVESLVDYTYELNMEKNEFVKIWDKYVNNIDNGASKISEIQKFDLDVIRALVQFADRLRQDFKKNFEKTMDKKNALPVFQPLTSREMRRCAYLLSKMPEADKLSKDSDGTARDLIKEFFLSNIYKTDDRKNIENALKLMSSKNRVA